MEYILKDNTLNVEVSPQRKPYTAPRIGVIDVECGISFLAGSDPEPEVDDDDESWADDDCGMW